MTTIQNRERRLRRKLARYGLKLEKTPARSYLRHYESAIRSAIAAPSQEGTTPAPTNGASTR